MTEEKDIHHYQLEHIEKAIHIVHAAVEFERELRCGSIEISKKERAKEPFRKHQEDDDHAA